jgi:serine protease AprX
MRFRTCALLVFLVIALPAFAGQRDGHARGLDSVLRNRARQLTGSSRVIVEFRDVPDIRAITSHGGIAGRKLSLLKAQVAQISNSQLASLADDPRVARISVDRPAFAMLERTAMTTGVATARQDFGVTGAGIGIALIDSGVSGWHDDLNIQSDGGSGSYAPRVVHFKDFVNLYPADASYTEFPFDDYGHGTHVAGIIAGTGFDSNGARTGVAPGASIVGLKVLDSNGAGYISDVIAAIDYAVSIKDAHHIRIINLSVGAGVYESYEVDPLAQAARRAVDAGIVVVAASGNFGRNANGESQYGGITSPGNAPWVLTVGASNHQGSTSRSDDTVAPFSSRGPSWINFTAKPDIVAPGVGIESLAEPWTTLYSRFSPYLLPGTDPWFWYFPYLSLSGTSMAAPVVSGTIALMLEANPRLTPNAVKAILQYTAQVSSGDDFLTQGAGFLNARGAVRLARFWANPQGGLGEMADPIAGESVEWGRHMIWGNYRLGGGVPLPAANAWTVGLTWGATTGLSGDRVVWGAERLDNIVWSMLDDNIVWSMDDDNIVWSMDDNIVWSMQNDNIVWSMNDAENIVWSMDCGGADCESVLWGQRTADGTLWGALEENDNIVWSMLDENIVWSMLSDNIVWSMSTVEPTLWTSESQPRGKGHLRPPTLPQRRPPPRWRPQGQGQRPEGQH